MRRSNVFKFAFAGVIAAVFASSVHADAITPGNLVIQREGDGVIARGSYAAATYLDEYAPNGTFVQSILMNNTGTGSKLVNSGTGTSEGKLGVSENGRYVALFGYNATVGTSGVKTTASRTIGCVDVSTGNVAYTTGALGGNDNARSVAVNNAGTGFWNTWGHGSTPGGVNYITAGSSPTITPVYTAAPSAGDKFRALEIYGGQLYISGTGTGGELNGVGTVGMGLPTSAASVTALTGVSASEQFFMADLSQTVAGYDTLYTTLYGTEGATDSSIAKYTYNGSTWTADGAITGLASVHGLTGVVTGTSVTLYALYGSGATDGDNTYLGKITDPSGYDGTLSGSMTLLATSPAHEVFRGIGFVAVPEPSTIVLAGAVCLFGLVVAWRRRRAA
jgi:hypothetical protein